MNEYDEYDAMRNEIKRLHNVCINKDKLINTFVKRMEEKMNLSRLSKQELRKLSKKSASLANDLENKEPSYILALNNGIQDKGYNTTANGFVSSYSGEAEIIMDDGRKWKAIGHAPTGDAWSIHRQGYIEFIPQ